ncbi:MAG: hypothetical protein Q8N18_14845 [Opitutaceae bacterium]|nr:hypothetical protein [Opitutaceae bacterium]
MISQATTAPVALPAESGDASAKKALTVGIVGIALTAIGLLVPGAGAKVVATSWLVGLTFWSAMAIGMLMLVMIHHIFDASWSTVIRRQFEHGLASFKWLLVLFIPLLITPWIAHGDLVWPWMNLDGEIHGGHTVGHDPLYLKKAGFLNKWAFVFGTIGFFLLWMWLSARLRKASFSQDSDGDLKWTFMSRKTAAFGIPIGALTLTAAAIYWVKSLEYHWFSTMYGVWFFANCARGALAIGILIMIWLWNRGDYKGVLNTNHFYSIGMLSFAFTVFWAYVTFSQYFLIWNANVPEETFWYNLRELNHDGSTNQWWYVGLVILFGHFVVPFLYLLSYKHKVVHSKIKPAALWILGVILIDVCYNVLPILKDAHGDARPFLTLNLLWVLTSVVGVGGVCVWSYLRSLPTAKLIPIRDPRIGESLTHHE